MIVLFFLSFFLSLCLPRLHYQNAECLVDNKGRRQKVKLVLLRAGQKLGLVENQLPATQAGINGVGKRQQNTETSTATYRMRQCGRPSNTAKSGRASLVRVQPMSDRRRRSLRGAVHRPWKSMLASAILIWQLCRLSDCRLVFNAKLSTNTPKRMPRWLLPK